MTDYPKMDAEIKARWVKALRSGRYRQTCGVLWRVPADSNCCLGVLGRVARLETVDYGTTRRGFGFGNEKDWATLPYTYCQEIGLSVSAQNELVDMNDKGKCFPEIADWIEQNL